MAGITESYLPAFGLALGMSAVTAGLLASLPLLAGGVLQLVAPRAIARVRSLPSWICGCMAVQTFAFAVLVGVALTGAKSIPLVFGAVSLYWASGHCAAAGWTPWMARVVPARLRGRFFGRRQALVQAMMFTGLIGSGIALHASSNVLYVYAAMFAVAGTVRLVSVVSIGRQGHGVDRSPRRRARLRSLGPKLKGTPRAKLLGYLVAMGAAAAISSPFVAPYLLVQQHLDYAQYCAFTASILFVKVIALPIAGKIIPRVGLRRVLTVSAIAIVPIPLLWLLSDSFAWFIVMQCYAGIAWAGFDIGILMALFDADDDSERISLQVMFSALQAIATSSASLVGGAVLGSFGADHHAYLVVFVVSGVARIAAAAMLVHNLPRLIVRIPSIVITRAWLFITRRPRVIP